DNNLIILKFIPDEREPLARNLILDYYGYIPIISLRNFPLDIAANKVIKRVFDIIFSIIIIIGLVNINGFLPTEVSLNNFFKN
ncbi:MAG: hypothetical protein RIT41_1408, partial [Bacteroidota bacterium]